jgi:phage terminase small subunit
MPEPACLTERLSTIWQASYRQIDEAGDLTPAMEALLEEFVFALKGAQDARFAGVSVAEDKAVKRASQLADQLGLSPKTRRKASAKHDKDPFAALDELEQKRQNRAQAS